MTEDQLREIERRASADHVTSQDALVLVAEVRMLRKLVDDLRGDMRSLQRIWGETQHQ